MTLHTLNASPASAAFADCLRLLTAGDALLLMGDGVYAALAGCSHRAELDTSGAMLYVLRDDAAAAGVLDRVDGVTVVDIDGFVTLSEQYARQLAWF
ncbi:MAG: sulfurtransferase complex subunit TusB [Halioglobus sp.]|nr:sulfurtransferase complex subunit TusB [Halioglobus sp.]MCB1708102.1 sulfurtransferase complex subunit TusB [Halioglobus sp.]MCP5122214.1 sulfurtransferase complex subunit TusB [Pseudomonadales bacterium]MCP5192241.1 sulfurtransferase complex subunit TusB [Pseudomonadales bacterium]